VAIATISITIPIHFQIFEECNMRHLFILSLFALSTFAQAESRILLPKMPAFTAVSSNGAIDVDINVGAAQSVTFKGKAADLKKIKVNVVDGELQLDGSAEKSAMFFSDDKKFVITMPAIRSFKGKGVGVVDIEHITGDEIDISYEGAGELEASGNIKTLRLKANGVGEVDTKKLRAENVEINLQGVGEAKVFASKTLNAEVKGVGALTYFGNPATVNKTGEGIGSIRAGKN
jgi:hypothetical protein